MKITSENNHNPKEIDQNSIKDDIKIIFKRILFDGELFISKKKIDLFSYIIIPISLIFICIISNYYDKLPLINEELGGITFKIFLLIIFIKPLSSIFIQIRLFSKLIIYRRELGILMFYFGLAHGLTILLEKNLLNISFFQGVFFKIDEYFFGLITIILLIPLYLTSNNKSIILLKSKWKKLHKIIVYLCVFLISLHIIHIENLELIEIILQSLLIILYFSLKILEWKKYKFVFKSLE